MTKPRVSVCMPAYNHERFVGAAVRSVLDQDYANFELIVVDDASPDGTWAALQEFDDPRLRLHRNATNVGSTHTFHRALSLAGGEFVSIIASDDTYLPGKLAAQVAAMDADPRVAAVFGHVEIIDDDGALVDTPLGELFHQENRPRAQWLRRLFEGGNALATPTAMLRRSAMDTIGLHNPMLVQAPDFEYWIRTCLLFEIHVIPRPLAGHRIHSDGSNLSADSIATKSRAYWEWVKLLSVYEGIDDLELMRAIFPESEGTDLGALPPAALLVGPALASEIPPVRVFGLDVLYRLLSVEAYGDDLRRLGYTRPFLSAMCAAVDPFGLQAISAVRASRDRVGADAAALAAGRAELVAAVDALRSQNADLAGLLAAKDEAIATLSGVLGSQSSAFEKARAELLGNVAELEASRAELLRALDELRSGRGALSQALADQAAEFAAVRDGLLSDVAAHQSARAELLASLAAQERSRDELLAGLDELRAVRDVLAAGLSEKDIALADQRARFERVIAEQDETMLALVM